MENYTRAFDFLLREASKCGFLSEEYRTGGKYKLTKWIDRDLAAKLNQFHAEPFKDSLKLDFAMTLSGYLELKARGKKAGFPGEYTDRDGNLTGLRPIFFCRHDAGRDYCLLYDPAKSRYFVKLYLMNQKNARKSGNSGTGETRLEHVHKNREKLDNSSGKCRYLVIPLSFGKWQEQYLKLALEDPGMLKTARLLRRSEEYYLSINISLAEKETIQTETFLGISRGPEHSVCLAVTNQNGAVRELDSIEIPEHPTHENRTPPKELYSAVNQIVQKAVAGRSQVIVENLADYSDGAHDVDFNCGKNRNIFQKSCYQTLERILDYKLEQAGLPKSVRVSPFGIFSTCPVCGLNTKKNRSARGMFLCVSCGAVYNLRSLGSINLANRLIKYRTDNIKIKVKKEDAGFRLLNETLNLELKTIGAEDIMGKLDRTLSDIVREERKSRSRILSRREFKKKWSMIRKIESYDDVTKHITFI